MIRLIYKLVRTRSVMALVAVVILVACPGVLASEFDSTDILLHIHGAATGSKLGVSIDPIGDINNDGFGDIAIASYDPIGMHIFYGGDPADSTVDLVLRGVPGSALRIDMDGDGLDELLTAAGDGIFFYSGFVDSIASVPYDSLGFNPPNDGWHAIFDVGFVDSDSVGDLVTCLLNTPGGPTLRYFSSSPVFDSVADWSFKVENNSHIIYRFGFIDFNGDTNLDIFAGFMGRLDSIGYVYIFNGPDFGSQPDVVIAPPAEYDAGSYGKDVFAESVFDLGDVTGDGWADLGVRYGTQPFIYCGGPVYDTLYDYILDGHAACLSEAGDVNHDGQNDLLAGGSRTMDGIVDLYLGGDKFDESYDLSIYRANLPPVFLDRIGYKLAPAGDFNGDGYDDFMFSCQNFAFGDPGDVFIVKGGPTLITSVPRAQDNALPQTFELLQNYPNPFNASTKIEFSLPIRSRVTLSVFNILGREVTMLMDESLPAGTYTVNWDGTDKSGSAVSSGVYLYRLTAGKSKTVKKMVLLK